jgi:OOP family OmpA-OmpF porin
LEKGISGDRVTMSFFGESRPVADNKTESNRKKNRRVEFIILKM